MRALLDANVLFPTVMRAVLLAVAERGLFVPLWSERIEGEWVRAAARDGGDAGGEAAMLRLRWPEAMVAVDPATEAGLWLPDPADVHVLAAALDGAADVLVTQNLRDFPRREAQGLAVHPDAFLMERFVADPARVDDAVEAVRAEAERRAGAPVAARPLLKRARLPRLGKAVG